MIIKTFYLDNVKVSIDDEYLPKTKEEQQRRLEIFNQCAWDIIDSLPEGAI